MHCGQEFFCTNSGSFEIVRGTSEAGSLCVSLSGSVSLSLSLCASCCAAFVWQVSVAKVDGPSGWKKTHEVVREQEALPTILWSDTKSLTGLPPSLRIRDVVNVTYQRFHKKTLELKEQGLAQDVRLTEHGLFTPCDLVLDVSQDVKRHASTMKSIRSMCSGSMCYHYSQDRMILPTEHMAILGWQHDRAEAIVSSAKLTAAAVRDLSGESMASPCVALATCVACLHLGTSVWENAI